MQLKDIKITGINVIATVNGDEQLTLSVAFTKNKNESFLTKSAETHDTLTLEHLQDLIDEMKESVGVK